MLWTAVAVSLLIFGGLVFRFHEPDTGLTSMLSVGDKIEELAIPRFRAVPHYVFSDSYGYDGSYYVQLALSPRLGDPALPKAIDNLPYRARRILLSATAWALGGGQPRWIVPLFPWLNVVAWFGLAAVLLRCFPPDSWDHFFRWFAVLFSQGVAMSVSHSLTDLPSLLLLAAGVLALARGRPVAGIIGLALATLTKETSVLAAGAFHDAGDRAAKWRRTAVQAVLVALPLALWLGYIRWKLGAPVGEGMNNFAVPLAGLGEKWRDSVAPLFGARTTQLQWVTVACTLALTVQIVFVLARWRPREIWWRVALPFAVMALFLARPVWEGEPGASTRVLLPLTLAFNVLVPRGRCWLPLLVAGNLTVVGSVAELTPPPRFYRLDAPRALATTVEIKAVGGWYGIEQRGAKVWRWSSGAAGLQIRNRAQEPVMLELTGFATARDASRHLTISWGERILWAGDIGSDAQALRLSCLLPPGAGLLQFTTDRPPPPADADQRRLAFSISDLTLALRPPAPLP